MAIPAAAMGFIAMMFWVDKVTQNDPCCEAGHDPHPISLASLFAMSICSLNDGLLLALAAPVWYAGIFFGMLLHKVTSQFALTELLIRAKKLPGSPLGWSIGYALLTPLVFVACASIGPSFASPLMKRYAFAFDAALGFSAGILLYTLWSGMLPHSRRVVKERPWALAVFVVALAVAIFLGLGHHQLHEH